MISARLPGSRSVSIAAYVLAGSRLETADQAGVAHFMEHLTFKGTADYPSSRAISEAIEGGEARSTRRPIGNRRSTGSASRAGRPSGRWTSWASSSCGRARGRGHRPGADRHRRGDPVVPRRPLGVRPDPVPAGDVRRRRAGARDLRRRGRDPRPARVRRPRLLAHRPTGPRTRSSPWPATRPRRGGVTRHGRVRDRQRRRPAVRAGAPRCPRVPQFLLRSSATRARRSSRWASRRSAATIRTRGRSPCSTRSSATACESPVPVGSRGAGARLRRLVRLVEYADAGALEVSAGVDPAQLPRCARGDPCASSRACATSRSRPRSWPRPRRTSVVAWSCGWTTRAISRHGSAARRRSTTGS